MSAATGSTRAASRAGRYLASSRTATSNMVAAINVRRIGRAHGEQECLQHPPGGHEERDARYGADDCDRQRDAHDERGH